ncbi:hypothetical protein [uncultured Gammaproteobacteria bacterium]|nr:hypothetical protein [uncultured Gammaproteobacteria bacterium]
MAKWVVLVWLEWVFKGRLINISKVITPSYKFFILTLQLFSIK